MLAVMERHMGSVSVLYNGLGWCVCIRFHVCAARVCACACVCMCVCWASV